ncbi:MAG: Uncharacterised protein [Flavobacteriales bacterium UBA4585]|nr:MAG: Uncharacterised protein [Flavobacteriales bacterium UBA4585]
MRELLQLLAGIGTLVRRNGKPLTEVLKKIIVKVYNVPVGAKVFGQLNGFTRVQFVSIRVFLKAIGRMHVIYQRHELFSASTPPAVDALLSVSNNKRAVWIFILSKRMLNEWM